MDAYHIALFVHIVTLIVAASATAVTKLAVNKRIRARSVREALEWQELLLSASRTFPLCLFAFTTSGAYMVTVLGGRAWTTGFVVSGFLGVILLLASGAYLGVKGKALERVLRTLVSTNPHAPPPHLVPPAIVAMLPLVNTGIALGVVFDMVTKPANVPMAIGIIAKGIVSSASISRRQQRARVTVRSDAPPAPAEPRASTA